MMKILKIIIYLILPIVGSYYFFWYKITISVSNTFKEPEMIIQINTDDISRPGFKNTLRKIFQAPFDLTYYELCFRNNSELLVENSKPLPLDAVIEYYSEDQNGSRVTLNPPLTIPYGNKGCRVVDVQKLFLKDVSYNAKVEVLCNEGRCGLSVLPRPDVAAEAAHPVMWDQIASSSIFFFSWWGLLNLLGSVYETLFKDKRLRNDQMSEKK